MAVLLLDLYVLLLNLRFVLNPLTGLHFALKCTMDLVLTCKSKTWRQTAVDAFRNCYVYVLCITCDVWFTCCRAVCDSAPSIALLRICMMNLNLKLALPLPLRPNMSGHAACSVAVLACSSDCSLLVGEV